MIQNIDIFDFAVEIGKEVPDWSTDGVPLIVYNVPISKLYYNEENGRVATWVSGYLESNPNKLLQDLNFDDFNNQIHQYIKFSNSTESFKKTYEDMKTKGQIRPGVILTDGRVVSGNRRVTVLRELYNDTSDSKFNYFKCFIVKNNLQNEQGRKQIKEIERRTQFGVDEKQDYDPIDRLVDVYNDLIGDNKIWTISEYTKKLSLKKGDVDQMYYKAIIMSDYLEYINKPKKFHIARIDKLDGPLQELWRIYKSTSVQEWNRIRIAFYSKLQENGDRTRNVRDLVKIYKKNKTGFEQILNLCLEDIESKEINKILYNKLEPNFSKTTIDIKKIVPTDDVNLSDIQLIDINKVLSKKTDETIFDIKYRTEIEQKRTDKANKILNALDVIITNIEDTYILLKSDEKTNLKEKIKCLEVIISKFNGE